MRNGTRMRVGIMLETGEAREVHHFCLLLGYGAGAVNPYLALDSVDEMVRLGTFPEDIDVYEARKRTSRPPTRACSR